MYVMEITGRLPVPRTQMAETRQMAARIAGHAYEYVSMAPGEGSWGKGSSGYDDVSMGPREGELGGEHGIAQG